MTSTFELLPAVDLRGGDVVRLRQGDFGQATTYGHDPLATARRLAAAGARWLHVVDLDGARAGKPRQLATIADLIAGLGDQVDVEVAGGLRSLEHIDAAFAAGAARLVLGTAAIRDPSFAGTVVGRHGPARIAVAIDVRGGRAVGEAWRADAEGVPVMRVIEALASVGMEIFEVTSIARDGTRSGPELELYRPLVDRGWSIIASGGIATIGDLVALRDLGCAGAIVGRALYEGDVDLAEALHALEG